VKLAVLDVEGPVLDDWTVAPLFALGDDGSLRPRSPAVELVDDPAGADLGVLPALWGAHPRSARPQVEALLDDAAAGGRRVVVWVEGDQEVDLDHPAAVLLEHGPQASRRRAATVHAWPVLVHDHLANRFDGAVDPVPRGDAPLVGFCGQAAAPWSGHARLLAGKARARLAHALGRTDRLAPPWASHLRLRRRALAALADDPRVVTDYVVRDRYRAGLVTHAERADRGSPTATDFFANIRRTAYTVCVRGGGNFSTRLYEALCLGRIPIVVDSDQRLPWAGVVPWDELAVVVPADRLDQLADRVVDHHARLDDRAFADLQVRCRQLWVDRLSAEGFLAHLPELLA
jgi:hypothetical protein